MAKYTNNLTIWIERFIHFLYIERRASQHTRSAYKNDLDKFNYYLQKYLKNTDVQLSDFERNHVRRYLSTLTLGKYSARSIARKLASFRTFTKFLIREGGLSSNPTINIVSPKLDKKLPNFLTKSEVKALLQLPDLKSPNGFRDFLILELFYATGMRVSELAQLLKKNIVFDQDVLRIKGKGNKERLIPMGQKIKEHLKEYIHYREKSEDVSLEPDEFIFVSNNKRSLTRYQVAAIVKKYVKRVADVEKAHPHALRHTFATHLLNEGADLMSVKELLGHVNLNTTQIYTHVSAEHLKRIYKKAHPRAQQ